MNNMNQMMKQVKKMQEQMAKAQAELEQKEIEGTAGGGVVKVKMNGHKKVLNIQLKPEVVDPEDIEMLQDLLTAAINDALQKVDEIANQGLSQYTNGMKIPGLF